MDEKLRWLAQITAYIKDLGLYPGRHHWEILSKGVRQSDLCIKDHSSLWVGKGLEKARRNRGPPQTQQWRMDSIFKDYRKEGAGAKPCDQNPIWAYSEYDPHTVTGVSKNDQP